jgi:hypothetical protein
MKRIKLYIAIFVLGYAGLACQPNDINNSEFEVQIAKPTVKVGEAVTFNFSGNPDFIAFYSGEPGKRFGNLARKKSAGKTTLQFTSLRANGQQQGSLRLMVSVDFSGVVPGDQNATVQAISNARWTDITDRAKLSEGASQASGAIDLSDFAAAGKPVYIAFKYLGKSGAIQNKWTINGLSVVNTLPDASAYTIANLTATPITNYGNATINSPGWVAYSVKIYNWVLSTSSLVITGATSTAAATEDAEAWAITGAIDLQTVTPDVGIFVKGMDTKVASFSYVYLNEGNYTASFVGAANNFNGKNEVVKEIQLTVSK